MTNPATRASPQDEHALALTLYQAFRRSNDVMFYCDRDGVIRDVNEAFVRHYGWSREEAVGQNPRLIRSQRTTDETYKEMWGRILDPNLGFWRGELVNRARDGREVPIVLTITAVRDERGEVVGYISNGVEVGELRSLQERVAQAEALAQLGQMAAVVAHEIRNPLGSITMAARQLANENLPREDRELVLQILRDEGRRLNETLTNFLAYARPRSLRLERADLNVLVGDVARVVAEGQPDVRIETALDAGLAPFRLDSDQVRQIVWNLALNAAQAVAGQGRVRLSTGRREGFVLLRVEDDGPGVAESSRDELFQPFKTTKSQGTGLGLAIADRIARAHGGRIEAGASEMGGAAFTVLLPTAQA
ncbi:MAG: PAS domain S-box protein [Elusimicrobia bacterium]|nr:PAS domain S-box protein [Elusimicrobiota bacterium]